MVSHGGISVDGEGEKTETRQLVTFVLRGVNAVNESRLLTTHQQKIGYISRQRQ